MSELSLANSVSKVLEGMTEPTMTLYGGFGEADTAEHEESRLDFELAGRLMFTPQATMTEEETRRTFSRLVGQMAARSQCHLLIQSAPPEIFPTILAQLQDLVEYEIRMWQVCREVEGPDVRERWVSLPIET